MQYAHLFNTRGGRVELYLTDGPDLAGAKVHTTYPNLRAAKAAVKAIGAKPWNF